MVKKIIFLALTLLNLEHALSAKCIFDNCGNGLVFVTKNADKSGPSVCKAKDGSMKPYSYYAFRINDGSGQAVRFDATGLNGKTGLCNCGHSPWMHRVDSDNFPLDLQTQNANEVPVCPEGY